jgi:GNAT superfamily N-acetyltransferase
MVPSVKEQFKDDYLCHYMRHCCGRVPSQQLLGSIARDGKGDCLDAYSHSCTDRCTFHCDLVDELLAELHNDELEPADRVSIAEAVLNQTSRSFGYLALEDDSPVGVLLMTERMSIYAGGAFGQITELYVRPECRFGGVAAALVREAAKFGKERGWKRLDVGAPDQPRWARALVFYLSAGFVEVGPRLRLDL